MGRVWKYYSNWQEEQFRCNHCRWIGNVGVADLDYSSDVAAIIECPKCYRSLGVVQFPNLNDTEQASAQGNAEAMAALPKLRQRIKRNEELLERFRQRKIERPGQLPELEGEGLEFGWDFVQESDGEFYQIIRLAERELWREPAFFSSLRRFEDVKQLLRENTEHDSKV